MVSGQQLCRILCVKKYDLSSSRKLCVFLYIEVPYCQQSASGWDVMINVNDVIINVK